MRLLIALCLIAAFTPSAAAEPAPSPSRPSRPSRIDERGISIPRSEALPRRTYAWSTWLVGSDEVHVLVVEGELGDRPARYQAFDNQGNALWTADHSCPNFDDYTTLFAVGGRLVCKWKRQIVAVDIATGKEAWRFKEERPLYITTGAQGRIAVSVDNEQVAVLDAKDGHETLRIDVDGGVLEAVATTPAGPLALLVHDTPGRPKDTIELAIGEGGALEKVELSGEDAGRRLVALPIGGPDKPGVLPMKPRWTAPFEGYSFELTPAAGVVVGEPRENVTAAWDLDNGKLLWERPATEGEILFFGDDGAAFARADTSGNYRWGALDIKTLATRWEQPLPAGDKALTGGQGSRDVGLVTSGGFLLARYSDGKARASLRTEQGLELPSLRSTPRSLVWVTQRDAERWLHFKVLPPL